MVAVTKTHWSTECCADPISLPSSGPIASTEAKTINWLLIGIASIYLVWSAVHLPTSIWARAILFSLLLIRMKPDVILPMLMVTPQMTWLLLTQAERGDSYSVLENVYAQLTGAEQYALTVPIILIPMRVLLGWSANRLPGFPSTLFILWLAGGVLVLTNTVLQIGSTASWGHAIRTYSVMGMYFFGMLLPQISEREINKLLLGIMIIAIPLYVIGLKKDSATQLLYVVSPLAVGTAVFYTVQRRVPISIRGLAIGTIGLGSYFASVNHSMMHSGAFAYAAFAVLGLSVVPSFRGSRRMQAALLGFGTLVTVLGLMTVAIWQFHRDGQVRRTATTEGATDYVSFKLFEERATIWYGQVVHLLTEANPVMPVFGQPFEVQLAGQRVRWSITPHNLPLAVLRLFGFVAGSAALLVLGHLLVASTRVLWLKSDTLWMVVGVASLANVLIGGLTLEYVITEWQSEWFLALAGLTSKVANAFSKPGESECFSTH